VQSTGLAGDVAVDVLHEARERLAVLRNHEEVGVLWRARSYAELSRESAG
jgi:hypothetical protein